MQKTKPPLREILGCDEQDDSAVAKPTDRPGTRGQDRLLHVGPLGLRLWRCPRKMAATKAASEAWEAFLWWDKGCDVSVLTSPLPPPNKLVDAIRVVRQMYNVSYAQYLDRKQDK